MTKKKPAKKYRESVKGKFVTEEFAKANPNTTQAQTISALDKRTKKKIQAELNAAFGHMQCAFDHLKAGIDLLKTK